MFVGCFKGYEKGEKEIDGHAIYRVKIYTFIGADKGPNSTLKTFNTPVWNRDAISQSSAAEAFPRY